MVDSNFQHRYIQIDLFEHAGAMNGGMGSENGGEDV